LKLKVAESHVNPDVSILFSNLTVSQYARSHEYR